MQFGKITHKPFGNEMDVFVRRIYTFRKASVGPLRIHIYTRNLHLSPL